MRFIVFIDLFATLVMPASVAYLFYLIYLLFADPTPAQMQVLILIGITYGLQAIIFLMNKQWQHIGWMIIHILAMPVFYFYIPLYSFWNFDDFSWGNTRKVEGDSGKGGHDGDGNLFDVSSIPTMTWESYKKKQAQEQSAAQPKVKATGVVVVSPTDGDFKMGSDPYRRRIVATSPISAYQGGSSGAASGSGLMSEEEAIRKGLMPTDAQIAAYVRVHLASSDLQLTTKKSVRIAVSQNFGVNMDGRRDVIGSAVDYYLTLASNETSSNPPVQSKPNKK
jgi:Chitin synthase/DEK C terminal domain